jgi:IS1 family transposase
MAELQADEMQTIVGGKEQPIWVFAVIDVWSRLWPSTVIGGRSYRNTLALFRDVSKRMNPGKIPLITTDGFEFYKKVIGRVFGEACLYGQVIKTRRNDRIVKVERGTVIGGAWGLQKALRGSEDSSKLNTSFIERLNLTIRQGSAYLFRRTICQARWKERLADHLELFRCYYNFVRPHRALKFGRAVRTPAMQAGLTTRRLKFREIFSSTMYSWVLRNVTFVFFDPAILVNVDNSRLSMAA